MPGAPIGRPWQSERVRAAKDWLGRLRAILHIANHLVIQDRPGKTVIASKMLYASHYFWTALEERVLQTDPARGSGFWFVTVSRSRSDGLKGFIGRFVRGRVRSEVQRGIEVY